MHASFPSFAGAIAAIDRVVAAGAGRLSRTHIATLGEVRRRLGRLAADAERLIELNNQLVDSDGINVRFDPETNTVQFGRGEATISSN